MTEDMKHKIIEFIENFDVNKGKSLIFREAISTNKDNFDRHFTSYSKIEFILLNFTVRISGARMMFDGDKMNYEIGVDHIIQFEDKEGEIEILEALSEKVYRRTIIKIN